MFLLRCRSNPVDCTTIPQAVDANPDIAGIGVLVSFVVMTGLSIIFGFLVITLELCHERSERRYPHRVPTGRPLRHSKYWLKVCTKILLGLSDTQLLTGLAMQFSVYLLHCTVAVYYFKLAICLTYLSTITHLLTMVALKSYFIEHWGSSIPRMLFIILNIGLFCYEVFIFYGLNYVKNPPDDTQSLACYYRSNRPSLKNPTFAAYWFTIITVVIVIHAIGLWYIFKDFRRERKAQNKYKIYLSRLPVILVVVYITFAFIATVPALRHTKAMGPRNSLSITIDNTKANEKAWTFGQILPVLLLAVPALTGLETICEVYGDEKKRKQEEISRTRGEIVLQQASEHDLKSNCPGPADQSISEIQRIHVHTSSRDTTPHGSTQQVGGRWY